MMKAVQRRGPGAVSIVEKDMPVPGSGEVLIRVSHTGICGSDVHRFTENNPKWDSLVLGHEFSGTVASLGAGVTGLTEGEKVTAVPLVPCHQCEFCGRGEFSLCERYTFIGSRIDGSFAEYTKVPAVNIVKLGAGFPLEKGAFVEPVTVCLHPILRLPNLLGKTVAVTGLGTIGLLAVQIFRAMGARHIAASDVVPEKLALAAELGATRTVNAASEKLEDVLDLLGGADVVFESSGNNSAKLSAIRIAKGRGTVLLVGTSPKDITFDSVLFERITRKELNITGSWMNYSAPWPGSEWSTAVWMLKEGLIRTEPLVTHNYSLTDFQKGLDVITGGGQSAIKVMISPEASR
jgi:threonine dehydrogenase-like Zn-dependent dehydrogenase